MRKGLPTLLGERWSINNKTVNNMPSKGEEGKLKLNHRVLDMSWLAAARLAGN